MKVSELIDKLKESHPNATVKIKGLTDASEYWDGEIIDTFYFVTIIGNGG